MLKYRCAYIVRSTNGPWDQFIQKNGTFDQTFILLPCIGNDCLYWLQSEQQETDILNSIQNDNDKDMRVLKITFFH